MSERRRQHISRLQTTEIPHRTVAVITDKNTEIPQRLLNPHYTDERFNQGPLTVFLAPGYETEGKFGTEEVTGAHYEYSDRLTARPNPNDPDEYDNARTQAFVRVGSYTKPAYFEELLRILNNNPKIELVHILAGVIRMTGYSYRAFGTIDPTEQK